MYMYCTCTLYFVCLKCACVFTRRNKSKYFEIVALSEISFPSSIHCIQKFQEIQSCFKGEALTCKQLQRLNNELVLHVCIHVQYMYVIVIAWVQIHYLIYNTSTREPYARERKCYKLNNVTVLQMYIPRI